jgi:uncharacterized membrane protein YfcA
VIDVILPPALDQWGALALIALSAFTSALSAAVGIGGGVTLLAAMTFVIPVPALIPVHAVVQLGSNVGRLAILLKAVAWRLLAPFLAGGLIGAAAGGALVTDLPEAILLLVIGVFVTMMAWLKVPPLGRAERGVIAAGGAASTMLTMFVGATGPFVITLFRQSALSHRAIVATNAAAMSVQHVLKIVVFGVLGFSYAEWVPLIAAMIAAGFAGTVVGARYLSRVPEQSLKTALKLVLTVIGIQLVIRATLRLAGF